MVGGAKTLIVALAVPADPLSVELTAPVVLLFAPAAVEVTPTVKVHEPLAGSVALDRLIVDEPATALIVPPPHVPDRPLGDLTTRPAGSESLKPTPVIGLPVLGLVIVNNAVVEAPRMIDPTANDVLIVGA